MSAVVHRQRLTSQHEPSVPLRRRSNEQRAASALNAKDLREVCEFQHECPICFDTVPLVEISCGHKFCKPCMTKWTHTKIEENNQLALAVVNRTDSSIPCPTCRYLLTRHMCWQFVEESHAARLQELEKKADLRRKDGTIGAFFVSDSLRPLFATLACFFAACWVLPIPELQAVALLPLAYSLCTSAILKAELIKMIHCKLCPACHSPIIKNGGCSHMHCTCGHHFDWKRAPWYWRHSKSALLATLGLLLAAVLALLLAFDLLFTCLAAAQGWTQLSQTSSAFQSIRLAVSAAEQALRVGCLATSWVAKGSLFIGAITRHIFMYIHSDTGL